MSREDFVAEFRPELLLILAEAWAVRNEARADVAGCLERHHVRVKHLLNRIYDSLYPAEVLPLAANHRKA